MIPQRWADLFASVSELKMDDAMNQVRQFQEEVRQFQEDLAWTREAPPGSMQVAAGMVALLPVLDVARQQTTILELGRAVYYNYTAD